MRVESRESRVECRRRRAVGSRLALRPRAVIPQLSSLNSQPARGLTLIELLVVIIILSTLVSAAIPILAPSNDDRRLREASRGVNSFFAAAQMRAVQLQRPFGVAIKRLSQDTNTSNDPNVPHEDNAVSVELFYVEQPAPYRGFDRTSAAMICRHTNPTGPRLKQVMIRFVNRGTTGNFLPPGWDADLFPPSMIRPGDVIEIDGTRFLLLRPSAFTTTVRLDAKGFYESRAGGPVILEAEPINDTGQMINIEFDRNGRRIRDMAGTNAQPLSPYWTSPAPYKILRQPMPTSDEPFQMPEGTAIDLRASGLTIEFKNNTATGFFYNQDTVLADRLDNGDPVIVMFTPEGSVERLRLNQQNVADIANAGTPPVLDLYDERTTSNIYLLVGRRENAPPPALADDVSLNGWSSLTTEQEKQDAKETVNWLRGESRWIVIGSQSGRVATVENAFVEPGEFFNGSPPQDVMRARQIDAAREFAREMTQAGGR